MSQTPTPGRIVLVREVTGWTGPDDDRSPVYSILPAVVTAVHKGGKIDVHVFQANRTGLELHDSHNALAENESELELAGDRAGVCAYWPDVPAPAKRAAPAKDLEPSTLPPPPGA